MSEWRFSDPPLLFLYKEFILAKQPVLIPKYLQMRISEGEHQQLDFKYVINDSRKIAITLCAFANTDGGTLLIGVKDNGEVVGARLEEEIHMVEAAASMYCKPVVKYKTQGWRAGERYVLEVIVESSSHRPHQAQDEEGNWKAYVRKDDQNFPAPSVLMQYWKSDETNTTEKYFHTEKEKKLFAALNDQEGHTVSQLSKMTEIPRQIVTVLLARFMRWELITMDFEQGIAKFKSL